MVGENRRLLDLQRKSRADLTDGLYGIVRRMFDKLDVVQTHIQNDPTLRFIRTELEEAREHVMVITAQEDESFGDEPVSKTPHIDALPIVFEPPLGADPAIPRMVLVRRPRKNAPSR